MRNPWGQKEWKGNWSDNDNSWTQELKTFFNVGDTFQENGMFFIRWEDFSREFSNLVICYC